MDANRGLPVLTLQDLSPESHRPPPRIGTDLCLWDEEALQDGCSDQGIRIFFKKLPMLSWYVASIENHRPGPCIPEGGDPFYRSLGLWGPAQCVR